MPTEAPTIYPALRYHAAPAAMEFLTRAFGFRELRRYANEDGTIAHAEMAYGPSIIMLGSHRDDEHGHQARQGWLYVAVDDADVHCARAREAGAEIVMELYDTDYGSRDYAARDLEGNHWNFGTYRPGVDEEE